MRLSCMPFQQTAFLPNRGKNAVCWTVSGLEWYGKWVFGGHKCEKRAAIGKQLEKMPGACPKFVKNAAFWQKCRLFANAGDGDASGSDGTGAGGWFGGRTGMGLGPKLETNLELGRVWSWGWNPIWSRNKFGSGFETSSGFAQERIWSWRQVRSWGWSPIWSRGGLGIGTGPDLGLIRDWSWDWIPSWNQLISSRLLTCGSLRIDGVRAQRLSACSIAWICLCETQGGWWRSFSRSACCFRS